MQTQLDHLVIGATTLAEGVAYVERELGVTLPYGGEHPDMGTHNHLMRLGDDTFLEIIAINPAMDAPAFPRWFGLDDPYVQASLRESPRLITWVAATDDITATCARAGMELGVPTWLSRGDLRWQFAIPEDGALHNFGMIPYLIEWPPKMNAAGRLADLGCRLARLEIHHPNADWVRGQLARIGLRKSAEIHPLPPNTTPCLVAHINTPLGRKTLRSL